MSDTPSAATRASLEPIFSPRSVAVVGASRNRDSIGFALLHNLVMGEFQGAIFPINPKARSIHSLKAYPSIGDVPDPVDLAVIAVPKKLVLPVVDECIAAGVKGLVTITAGFAETGEEGAALERELCERVRAAGVRMIGPNCMGVINTATDVALNATFAPTPARPGTVGFVSQSGALGVAILNAAADLGIGLTQFVSMGNKADVSANDLAEYWEEDPETRVISMYLESFGNPRKFTEIAKRVSHKKPILVVKSGRTAEGARAATSHTGAIAGADVTVSAFLRQCGVLRANTIDELFGVARALDRCPLPPGNRVGIVTNAGGPAIMATDACVNLGLEMAELQASTRSTLEAFLPAEASVVNPVDMIASATEKEYAKTLEAVLSDDAVDMVIVVNVTPLLSNPIDILDSVAATARGSAKPVVAVMMATEEFYEEARARDDVPPVYRFPEPAARALAQLSRYAAWRRRPEEVPGGPFPVDDDAVERLLAATTEGYLPPEDATRVLELYGIPVAAWRQTGPGAGEAAAAAEELGYPVVLKAVAPELVHKSDAGAVRVDVRSPEELARALDEIEAAVGAAGHRVEGWLIQQLVRGGHEVIFGISTDPRFGPLLMFGLGGKYVEVFRDVRFGVPPLTLVEAGEMVRGIRGLPLLEGVRGEEAADLGQLEEILLRLSQLTQRHPTIQELDLNPFVAAPGRDAARAVDVRIRVGASGGSYQ
jgi:acetyl coenzyme A synthetase (ADP forming)-like protein